MFIGAHVVKRALAPIEEFVCAELFADSRATTVLTLP